MLFPFFLFHLFFAALFLVAVSYTLLRCDEVNQQQLHTLPKTFYRIKPCHRLNTSIVARARLPSFARCLSFAAEKRGLALNFSPKKSEESDDDGDYFMNCEVLGCPDLDNLTSLVNDSRFDYYSLYGNSEALLNSSCIPHTGVFHLHFGSAVKNYSAAQNVCMESGGHLAHVVSETRTLGLAQLLAARKPPWRETTYVIPWDTVAYIGLGDQQQEGLFLTEMGEPLECFRYRSWAPGHPRKNRKKDDCVILDDGKMWRAVHCAKRLPFFCELEPHPPFWAEYKEYANSSCSDFTNRTLKRKCKKVKKKYKRAQKAVDYDQEMEDDDRCEEY